jgi:hypothetical protein
MCLHKTGAVLLTPLGIVHKGKAKGNAGTLASTVNRDACSVYPSAHSWCYSDLGLVLFVLWCCCCLCGCVHGDTHLVGQIVVTALGSKQPQGTSAYTPVSTKNGTFFHLARSCLFVCVYQLGTATDSGVAVLTSHAPITWVCYHRGGGRQTHSPTPLWR